MSSQPVTRTGDEESVSEKAAENAADNGTITRVMEARLVALAPDLDTLSVAGLREVAILIAELERVVSKHRT